MMVDPQRFSIRVYYEDTDFSGRVYHGSYFRFFERGRTEWLRAQGLRHNALAEGEGLAFAVTRLEAHFSAPGFIDDWLEVVTSLQGLRGPVMTFAQSLNKDGLLLATASVDVVAIKNGRAVRPPKLLLDRLRETTRAVRQSTPPIP